MKLPKIYLRDIFWCITLVAIALGWLADRDRMNSASARSYLQREERWSNHWEGQWQRAKVLQEQVVELRRQNTYLETRERQLTWELAKVKQLLKEQSRPVTARATQ